MRVFKNKFKYSPMRLIKFKYFKTCGLFYRIPEGFTTLSFMRYKYYELKRLNNEKRNK